jgi:hypothetical protein
MPTVARILSLANVSQYLAANRVDKGGLFGAPPLDKQLSIKIYLVRRILQKVYDYDPNYTGVREVADYLYELIQKFAFKSAAIVDNNTGGQIAPPTPGSGTQPNDLDFEVTSGSIMADGETTLSIPQFIGYNVDFARGGIMQNTTSLGDGSSYYSWNNVTGIFTIFPAAATGELFRIMVDAGGGSSTIVPTQSYPFVITSADFEVDGITYLNSAITTDTLYLQANNTPNPFLYEGVDFIHVAGGIEVTLGGFDANTFNYTIVVNKLN